MKQAFFWIPAADSGAAQEELNRFTDSHRIVAMEKQFVASGLHSAWAVTVSYVDAPAGTVESRRERVDYRESLDPDAFARFAKLRDVRRKLADEQRVPAYVVMTNDQLAAIAQRQPKTLEELQQIEGIGEGRVSKYGSRILAAVPGSGVAAPQPEGAD